MDFIYLQIHLDELIGYMRQHGYAETYVNRYRTTVSQIVTNSIKHSWSSYLDVLQWYSQQHYSPTYLRELKAILGKLELFHCYSILPDNKVSNTSFRKVQTSYSKLNETYRQLVDDYRQNEQNRGLKESTLKSFSYKISRFLLELQMAGEDSLEKVTEKTVLSYFVQDGKQIHGATIATVITGFLKVCMELNNTEAKKIIAYIPRLRIVRKNIGYLTKEEFEKIRIVLDDIENGLSLKNRAVGMLLMYTGLRGCDIAHLLITSIDWCNDVIRLTQQKTGQPLKLPLTPLVGNAIYDYCIYERPQLNTPYVFLSSFAPHDKLTTDGIGHSIKKIMQVAEIRQEPGSRKGTHIFRHHLVTSLLGNGIPQPVITETLGHQSPLSLTPYLYADMVHLKYCAISIEQFPMGKKVFSHV